MVYVRVGDVYNGAHVLISMKHNISQTDKQTVIKKNNRRIHLHIVIPNGYQVNAYVSGISSI